MLHFRHTHTTPFSSIRRALTNSSGRRLMNLCVCLPPLLLRLPWIAAPNPIVRRIHVIVSHNVLHTTHCQCVCMFLSHATKEQHLAFTKLNQNEKVVVRISAPHSHSSHDRVCCKERKAAAWWGLILDWSWLGIYTWTMHGIQTDKETTSYSWSGTTVRK